MASRFPPLPLSIFSDEQKPYIARLNNFLREQSGLEGVIKQPITSKRSDDTVARRAETQVDVSRITPSISAVVSGSSTTMGRPGLTFGLTNTKGTSTSAVSVNSAIALFNTNLPPPVDAGTGLAGLSSTAANLGHRHQVSTAQPTIGYTTTAGLTGSATTLLRSDATFLAPTFLRSSANNTTLALTSGTTNQTLTSSLGILNINPAGNVIMTSAASGQDTGFLARNTGTGATDIPAFRLENGVAAATLFLTTAAHTAVPSTCGFFTSAANWFAITDGTNRNFQVDLTNFRIGINILPSHHVHVYRPSPVVFAGQVTTDAGAEYVEYAGLWSGGDIVASSRIQRDATNSSWDLDLYGSNWGGAVTKMLSVIGAQRVQINGTTLTVDGAIGVTGFATLGNSMTLTGTFDHNGARVGLYGATPTVQFGTTGTAAGFAAGTSATVTADSTFTGNTGSTAYTLGDAIRALKLIGAIAY